MARPANYFVRKCEARPSVDLAYLKRHGLLASGLPSTLTWSRGGQPTGQITVLGVERGVRLRYRLREPGGEWQEIDELIPFVWTATRFGSRRQWLQCPKCLRPCRILYGGTRFRCRCCHGLRYSSQYEPPGLGGVDQANKIRRRLGDKDGSAFDGDPFPEKPKGMHWKTYQRLEARYEELQLRWTVAAMQRFGITR